MFAHTVIYVEDDIETQKRFSSVLSNYFENILVFKEGTEALEAINNKSFDLLVTDIDIPNVSGLTLANKVKKKNPFIPVIVISAHSDYEILSQVIEIGVDGYILKPISSSKFINKILQTLEKNKLYKTKSL